MRALAKRSGPIAALAAGPIVAASGADHAVEGALALLLALGMLGPLIVVTLRPGTARAGSIVAGADARRPWLIAFGTTLFALLVRYDSPTTTVRLTMLVAAIAVAVALSADLRALVRLARAMSGAERLRLRTPASPPIDTATAFYDFGVGDEEREELAPPAAIYRERERVVRVVRGSRAEALRVLFYWIAFDVAVALPTLLTVGALSAFRVYPY